MTQKPNEVDAYLESLDPARRSALETIRALILETVPGVRETMRYRMPTFELDEVVCSLASQKHYISLYMDVDLVEKHKADLSGLDCGKSCIRFRKIEDLPLDTIRRILAETVERQRT
jgi:uncharacterized protein YdhG (YjbR/CyaY superfamily)